MAFQVAETRYFPVSPAVIIVVYRLFFREFTGYFVTAICKSAAENALETPFTLQLIL